MSIAKRVAEAVDKMAARDAEGALLPISAAVDATATKHFGRRGGKRYKEFIHENLGLITKVAMGPRVLNLQVKYDHPEIESDARGFCMVQDVLYHAVRCGLAHSAELPSTLRFDDADRIAVKRGLLVLPVSMVNGLIAAVVACPANADQVLSDSYAMNIRGFHVQLNRLWGRKQELENLFAAMDALC